MPEQNEHNALTPLKTIRLSPEERIRIGQRLRGHMGVTVERRSSWTWVSRRVAFAAVILASLGMGGTITLAHWSTPEDFFYPLRLAVNDRVELALTLDDDERLDKEMSQLERMMREEEEIGLRELAFFEDELEAGATDTPDAREEQEEFDTFDLDEELRELEREFRESEQEAEEELS